jgi:hypothetical protein
VPAYEFAKGVRVVPRHCAGDEVLVVCVRISSLQLQLDGFSLDREIMK